MKKIAILASGNGSNAEEIIKHFNGSTKGKVAIIASNKKDAYVLERAKNHDIPFISFSKKEMDEGLLEKTFEALEIDLVVLAGFLLKVPDGLIQMFPEKIINIHPALLPKFGGKGMYGMRVHEAVKEKGEKETGITIHYVNEKYDDGRVIFQESVKVEETDSPDEIAHKVHALEHKYFPKVIESLL
ncbi:phosphoribosylglycinamide formyltransferase [Echinicola vietnamensis]|uniref:Phosphoribosylglycinamide formyltransferase n=1 Tax=Echinicola vietnamensis (strain DSM 17526 / LMG 23754 / KMM 6221) TaxID=926556 RepID=L0FY98_ECHVK|nr:phosphoribosylglycinamide formyltransferase [Echinicola vietnamensis]AGA77736.1 phosphoribosylglycinamide formyltransferase, formyltetrahydrofolate-dependent [Echinicola vietnamensis DSM 17526]